MLVLLLQLSHLLIFAVYFFPVNLQFFFQDAFRFLKKRDFAIETLYFSFVVLVSIVAASVLRLNVGFV
jgi:hypothetical protein